MLNASLRVCFGNCFDNNSSSRRSQLFTRLCWDFFGCQGRGGSRNLRQGQSIFAAVLELVVKYRLFFRNSRQDPSAPFWGRALCDWGQVGCVPPRSVSLNPASAGECCRHRELLPRLMERKDSGLLRPRAVPVQGAGSRAAWLLLEVSRVGD